MLTNSKYYTLPNKYHPLLLPHTDSEMFLLICELIDKRLSSLCSDHNGVDSTISYRLNKVIVEIKIHV